MKYLFINVTADWGSTGRIAAEQCRELMAQGHTCFLAYGRECGCTDVPTVRIGSAMSAKGHALRARVLDDSGFGSRAATARFLRWVRQYDPDVIWLHNVHGYYIHIGLLFRYLKSCGKELHWTLHDCWAFTGHCAYFENAGCDRWKTGCHDCPQKGGYPKSMLLDNSRGNYRRKKELFTGIPSLQLRVPSRWLERRVKASFLAEYPVEVVYNRVNREVFRPVESDFRKAHGLEGKTMLLGVASVWEERKGLKDFVALSSLLPPSFRIVLVGLTPDQMKGLPENILCFPKLNPVERLVEVYSAADVFLNPSTEETFGMTTLEAVCCGTPAVVYRDTACQEIAEEFGGLAVPRGAEHLYEAVISIVGKETA